MIATIQNRKYRKGVDGSVRIDIYDSDGADVVLISAKLTLNRQGEILIDAENAPVTGTYMEYTILATHLDRYTEDMTLFVDYIIGSTTHRAYFLITCLKTPLVNCVITSDLQAEYPTLDDDRWLSQSNYQAQINKAFETVEVDLEAKMETGKADWIIDSNQLKNMIINYSLYLIFRAFMKGPDDLFNFYRQEHKDRYAELMKNVRFKYDVDDDADVDKTESFTTLELLI